MSKVHNVVSSRLHGWMALSSHSITVTMSLTGAVGRAGGERGNYDSF
jgi:hypothetical protein